MGFAKSMAIEADERGYGELDTFVCEECVVDKFLKNAIRQARQKLSCDYCGRVSEDIIAAPASVLIAIVAETVNNYFCEPSAAGVPYDGGYLINPISTHEVLDDLEFECCYELSEDIVSALNNDSWVPAAYGHWASSHEHEVLHDSWALFCNEVQHRTRFFFSTAGLPDDAEPQVFAPKSMLPTLGRLVDKIDLIRSLPEGHLFYRARAKPSDIGWEANAASMGAPPVKHARAGRMNPAGISYLYLARDQATAISEVVRSLPSNLVVATFEVTREILVLDLSVLPELPSIFDVERIMIREGLLFLEQFANDISQPVVKDGREHIDYVPSQVVCEYFAQRYAATGGRGVNGLVYPSALLPGGRNLVLFPTGRGQGAKFDFVAFSGATEVVCNNWNELAALVVG